MWSRRPGRISSLGTVGVLSVAVTAVVASAPAATAAPAVEQGSTAEYVVAFSGSPDAASAAIQAAGGQVEDVTEQVGVALVTSDNAAFLGDVRAQGDIRGATKNYAVGTSRPGMPHRFAEERPSPADRVGGGGPG